MKKLAPFPTSREKPVTSVTVKLKPLAHNEAAVRAIVGGELHESRLRRSGPRARLDGYVPPELAVEVRVLAARERRSVSDILTDALREYLARPRS